MDSAAVEAPRGVVVALEVEEEAAAAALAVSQEAAVASLQVGGVVALAASGGGKALFSLCKWISNFHGWSKFGVRVNGRLLWLHKGSFLGSGLFKAVTCSRY